jgi:putative nucleotidyltransferase with HDIG domain
MKIIKRKSNLIFMKQVPLLSESTINIGGTKLAILSKENLIKKVGDLKVLPFVARKLLETISNENASIENLSDIIEKDQTIAARVLKISNSALYGLRQEVTSLQQAIMILGLKTIRSLVLSVSTKSLYKQFGITEKMMWDHSVGAAVATKMISGNLGSEVKDVAFIGGLMHDVGKVFMNNETHDAFAEVMMKIYNDGIDSISAEEQVFGYTHADIGAKVIAKWGLSPVLVQILELHHLNGTGLDTIKEPAVAKGVACVNLADNICKVLGIGYRESDDSIVLHELPSAVFLKMNKQKLGELVEEVNETYDQEKSIFE